jgi:hypothetical protein
MGGVCQKPLENTAAPTVCRWHGLSRTLVSIIERQRVGRWAGFHGEPLAVREPAAKLIVDERESWRGRFAAAAPLLDRTHPVSTCCRMRSPASQIHLR